MKEFLEEYRWKSQIKPIGISEIPEKKSEGIFGGIAVGIRDENSKRTSVGLSERILRKKS